jgi:imidazolonepropionase-like amidohydrolase
LVEFWGAKESDALMAATRKAAEFLGLEGKVGTLEAGKIADLVAVKGNPLKDIRALRQVKMVINGGRLHHPATEAHKYP